MKTLKLSEWESSQSDKNLRIQLKSGQCRCLICEKPMYEENDSKSVRLLTNNHITLFEGEIDQQLDQGWFPVGNECFRKIENKFHKMLDNPT